MTITASRVVCPDRRRSRRRRRAVRGFAFDRSLKGFTYGNAITHVRNINTRVLTQTLSDRYGATRYLDYQYGYDRNGNPTAINDYTTPAPFNENRSLSYDKRDRATGSIALGIFGEELVEYDALDNVRRVAGAPNGAGGYAQDHRFQYPVGNNRLDRIDDPSGALQWDFETNPFGETTRRAGQGRTWTYQWNAAGRLVRAQREQPPNWREDQWLPFRAAAPSLFGDGFESATTTPDISWETYTYDAHGHRALSTRHTGTTRYQVYTRAGQLLYTEDSRDNTRIDYIHLGGKLVAQRSRPLNTTIANVTWHHTDHIGSANVETDATRAQLARTFRTPYGAPYTGGYREGPGYVTDTQTNLTYMQQRYYDPVALRFLSPDPVDVSAADGSNFNRYWYANNNPYKYRDPDGR